MYDDYNYSYNNHNSYECQDDEVCEDFNLMENATKSYSKRLRSCDFPPEVCVLIEQKIALVERRIHKYDNETLAAYAVGAFTELKIPYNMDSILEKLDVSGKKKKVLALISPTSTKNSPINESDFHISSIVKSPTEFIAPVLEKYFNTYDMEMDFSFEIFCMNIYNFSDKLCTAAPMFLNYEPRSCACAFIFYYLTKATGVIFKFVKKTHFRGLKFGKDCINPKNFDICFELIDKIVTRLRTWCSEDEYSRLIVYDYDNKREISTERQDFSQEDDL